MKLSSLTSEKWVFIIDRPEKLKQGIHLWYKGVPYPRRVFHSRLKDPNFFLRTLAALGTVKKNIFLFAQLKDFVFPYRFSIKKYEQFLRTFLAAQKWTLDEFFIKDDEFSVPVWEIGKFVKIFLLNFGFSKDICDDIALIIMMILEFDNAYRYRVQDLVGETSKENLKSLVKEIKRLFKIYLEREIQNQDILEWGARGKFYRLYILRFLFYLPKFRNAFLKALDEINLENIKFDINDRFHISFWRGYDYEGKSFDERYQFFLDTFKGEFPPFIKKENPQEVVNFMTGG
jgi:hypothetical protein